MRATAVHGPVDRLTDADLVPLRTDVGPAPMHLGAVLTLAEPVGASDVEAALRRRLGAVPSLRRAVHHPCHGRGRPVWRDDPGFDLSHHVTRRRCHDPGDLDVVLETAAGVLTHRLVASRPPWRAVVVTGPGGETAHAVVIVLHHVVADGVGGLSLLAALVDNPPHVGPQSTERGETDPARRLLPRVAQGWRELGRGVPHAAQRTSLNRPTGPRRVFRVVTIGLDTVRSAARRQDVTVNDLLLVAVTGAMDEVLRRRGEDLSELVVSVPVSGRPRPDGELGNHVGVMPVRVPLHGSAPARVREVGRLTAARRSGGHGESAALVGPAFRLLAATRTFGWFIVRQRLVNSFLTNVRGPSRPMLLCGSPIEHIVPMATTPGNVGVSFAVLSYAGELVVTAIADPDVVPEVVALTNALDLQLRSLVAEDGTSSPEATVLQDTSLGA